VCLYGNTHVTEHSTCFCLAKCAGLLLETFHYVLDHFTNNCRSNPFITIHVMHNFVNNVLDYFVNSHAQSGRTRRQHASRMHGIESFFVLHFVIVKTVVSVGHTGMHKAALERQDMSCTHLAHHELESI